MIRVLDYYKYQSEVDILHHITLADFKLKYDEIAHGEKSLVVASTILPVHEAGGCSHRRNEPTDGIGPVLYDCVIFYKVKTKDGPDAPEEEKKELKLDSL